MVNGIGNLQIDFYKNIQCDSVVRIDENGTKNGSVFFDRSHRTAKGTVTRHGVEIEGENSLSIEGSWLKLAKRDKNVKTVIRQLSYGMDSWVNLYRLLEVIEGDLGKKKKVSDKGWISDKKRTLFRRTANSVSVLGDQVRHGFDAELPPEYPIQLPSINKSLIG